MKIDDAEKFIPKEVYSLLKDKIEEFLPPQASAIKNGLFKGHNLLISAPTASGKTLIAEMAILNSVSANKKAIYIAPMRALISEKFEDFKREYPHIKSALSMGDYSENDSKLNSCDVLFASTEKIDSLLRQSNKYLVDVGCIIYDEIHLLTDVGRGPTLEFIISLNKRIFPHAQIIGLSATIGNAEDIADWLGADLIKSDFRPVNLIKKVYFEGELVNGKKEHINLVEDPLSDIMLYLIKNNKQALIFSQTKKSAIANAKLISKLIEPKLISRDRIALSEIANEVLNVLDRPTSQCEEVSQLIRSGVAFHHAGLINKQRHAIENGFRAGLIKYIVATPTLALGVNLPANTVVITSVYRYGNYGSEAVPKLEIEQMLGRAGRPKYDKEGMAIIIARNERDFALIEKKYIDGDIEPIVSKFNSESAIRTYTLALIDMGLYTNKQDIEAFFGTIFLSYFGIDISDKLEDAFDFLEEHEFIINENEKLSTTKTGKLINRLYLDPYTGVILISFITKTKGERGRVDPFSILHAVFCTEEFKFIPLSQSEFQKYEEESYGLKLYTDQNIVDYERFIAAIKMSHVISDWINEKSEKFIEEEYHVLPGEFYTILERLRWITYSMIELSRALGGKANEIGKLSTRIKYGIKEELLPLIAVPEIGRVRARKLFSVGIKTLAELKSTDVRRLSDLLGLKTAEKIYSYLHEKETENKLI